MAEGAYEPNFEYERGLSVEQFMRRLDDNDTNPKDRHGAAKPPLGLVPPAALIRMAKAMQHGADKYGPYNWREKAVRSTIYVDAAMRHLVRYLDGEDIDPDSGCPHIAHVAACMAVLMDATDVGNLEDDRPVPGPASRLIEDLTEGR
jgi:hypothetical protein